MENRRIFKVTGGEAMDVIKKAEKFIEKRKKELEEFYERTGAKKFRGVQGWPEILIYDAGTEPKEIDGEPFARVLRKKWGNSDDEVAYVPNNRTEAGKRLSISIEKLSDRDFRKFAYQMFEGAPETTTPYRDRLKVYFPSLEKYEDLWFVTVHKEAQIKPVDGLEEIKLSEYYALKGL
jgi:hypothetical protein